MNHLALQLTHQFAGDGFVLSFVAVVTVGFSLGLGLVHNFQKTETELHWNLLEPAGLLGEFPGSQGSPI